jgi:hypothetical protein
MTEWSEFSSLLLNNPLHPVKGLERYTRNRKSPVRLLVALEDAMIESVHSLQDLRPEVLFAALTADTGWNIADDHQSFLTTVIVVNLFLDLFDV